MIFGQRETPQELQEQLNPSTEQFYDLYNIQYQERQMFDEFPNDPNPSADVFGGSHFRSVSVKSNMSKSMPFNNIISGLISLANVMFIVIVYFYYSLQSSKSEAKSSIPSKALIFVPMFISLLFTVGFIVGLYFAPDILSKFGVLIATGFYIVTALIAILLKSFLPLIFLIIIIPNGIFLLYSLFKSALRKDITIYIMRFFRKQFYAALPSLILFLGLTYLFSSCVSNSLLCNSSYVLLFILAIAYLWCAKILSNCVYMFSAYFTAFSYFISGTDDFSSWEILFGLYRTHIQNFGAANISTFYVLLSPFRAMAELPPNRPPFITAMKFISEKTYRVLIYSWMHKIGSAIMLFFDKHLNYPCEYGLIYTGIFGIPLDDSKKRIAELKYKTYIHQIKSFFVLPSFFKFFRIPLASACACLVYAVLKEYNREIQNAAFFVGFFVTYGVMTIAIAQLRSINDTFFYSFLQYPDPIDRPVCEVLKGEYDSCLRSQLLFTQPTINDQREEREIYE